MTYTRWLIGGLLVLVLSVAGLALNSASAAHLSVLDLTFGNTAAPNVTNADIPVPGAPVITISSNISNTITNTNHLTGSLKVVMAIVRYFSPTITATQVISMHQSGWGFGEIFKALLFARESNKPLSQIIALRNQGMGWGQIAKFLGVPPGNKGANLGAAVSGRGITSTVTTTVGSGVNPGKPQNKGNPNEKGNSPGNGPGNNPGKGHDNGKGNGKK